MTNYLIRRFFQMIFVVFLSTLAIYILLNVAPGGPLSGLKLSADRKSRVSEADIARLESYLGLDKPFLLRYISWVIGEDWLGADWVFVGLSDYEQPKIGRDGNPMFTVNRDTGEQLPVLESYRFWSDPGVAHFNPGYNLWIWGTREPDGELVADRIRVKPPVTAELPSDVVLLGKVLTQSGQRFVLEELSGAKHNVRATEQTQFEFPPGEASTRPAEGRWLNISWLTGAGGLLGKYAGFHGNTRGVLRLDFGISWKLSPSQPVISLIESRLGNTIILLATATLLSLVVGIPIGIYSAVHQYSRTDYAVTTFAFFGSAMPIFWFGLMMILLFSYQFKQWGLPFMPVGGVASVRTPPGGSMLAVMGATPGSLIDRSIHLILPTLVLSLLYMATWSRYSRSSMLEVLRQDYVRTARAKGLFERVVIVKHALRNALIPVITILVIDIAGIFSGAVLTETIFSYPGMGRLFYDALLASDWPVIMAYLFIAAVLVVIATLVRDVLYSIVDPRIRFD